MAALCSYSYCSSTPNYTDGIATLYDGVRLPYRLVFRSINNASVNVSTMAAIPLVFGHGLGARDPALRSHLNDEWCSLVMNNLTNLPNLPSTTASLPIITYTARGHGHSTGWEHDAAMRGEQFHWDHLSEDMHQVVSSVGPFHRYIAGGSSMGSASALYCAMQHPSEVAGVIMIRPPTAWSTRESRRKHLIKSSESLECNNAGTGHQHHWVLRHTAYSDLPGIPRGSELASRGAYAAVQVPVMILTIKGDASHPVETATELASVLPQSEIHIAESLEEAREKWPLIIATFVDKLLSATP